MNKKTYKQFDSDPWWTTQVRKRYGDLLVGIDNQVWMYRKIPNGPVVDAVNSTKMLQVGEALDEAILEISTLTGRTRTKRRSIDKSAYRHCHLLVVNVPRIFVPPNIENRDYLAHLYQDQTLSKRVALLGVKLKPTTGASGGFAATMESIKHTLLVGGTPMSDYDKDRKALDAALARSGLHMPSGEDLKLANSWWNNGNHADIPYMPHGDHMHMFNTEHAARAAYRLENNKDIDNCTEWPDISQEHALAFSTIEAFDMDYMSATDPRVHWGASLLDSGAVAISVRFMIEPSTITREELRRHKKNYRDDIAERYANGKMERAEQEEMMQRLTDVEAHYAGGNSAPPTLTDLSITVAVAGADDRSGYDPTDMGNRAGASMDSMLNRQEQAFIDTMLCSPVRSNPHLHDLPSPALSYAGLSDLSVAGDSARERGAVALLGFSERDRQPMWMDAMAATDEDSVPICLVVGQSGSGKSVLMQWLADQYARTTNDSGERTPVIMIDLKEGALSLDTPIPMADGSWSTMGKLRPGDRVIGGDGMPCSVVRKSDIWDGDTTPMYLLTLDDGRTLEASHHHIWKVSTFDSRARARRNGSSPWVTLTTQQMVDGVGGGRYQLPIGGDFSSPERDVALDPYILGVRLGDGNLDHIPSDYLRASAEQRLELLRGLMDTGGTCHTETGRCSFSCTSGKLATQTLELVRSLGIKAYLNDSYTVTFETDVAVFRLAHKANRQKAPAHRGTVNIVESIEPMEKTDSQCIMVDSPDHTYLAGDYVVTHNSDFTTTVELTNGTCFTLSDLISDEEKDGVFDAIKFSITPQAGIDRAHSLIMQVNPFGTKKEDYETPLRQALSHGVDNGATCTGQALVIAARDNVNPEARDILERVQAAGTSPIFRAICGFHPDSPGLRVTGGTTYIRIGNMSLDLPSPGSTPDEQTQMQRTWLALVKAMVYGSISALANRQGVVLFDEGWIFLGSGRAEMEAMGRLARSQQVFPVIFTQRTQDALKAELEGYISRGVILPIEDPREAAAALKLFKLEETSERMGRITAKATRGDAGAEKGAPNWNSFRALFGIDPITGKRKNIRGTLGLYVDLAGNAVPTEIKLNGDFVMLASTNREDIASREKAKKAASNLQ